MPTDRALDHRTRVGSARVELGCPTSDLVGGLEIGLGELGPDQTEERLERQAHSLTLFLWSTFEAVLQLRSEGLNRFLQGLPP